MSSNQGIHCRAIGVVHARFSAPIRRNCGHTILDSQERGFFATLAPLRPNRTGMLALPILAISDGTLKFSGCDMLGGTPVLDITSYLPAFDVRDTAQIGCHPADTAASAKMRANGRMG